MAKKKRKLPNSKDWKVMDEKTQPMSLEDAKNSQPVVLHQGKYMTTIGIDDFLTPIYAYCDSCPFAPANGGDCQEYVEGADCQIERNMFQVLIHSLATQGVTDQDRMIVYPLVQDLFRMRRLNAIENEMDWTKFYSEDPLEKESFLEELEVIMKLTTNNSKGYMQKLKELLGTRKERESMSRRRGSNQGSTESFNIVMEVAEDDEDTN